VCSSDLQLAPAADAGNGGGHRHEVACLLPGQTRRALWAALRTGEVPEQALTHVDVPETAVDREAVGEVLAPAGTEVAEGVVAEGVVAEAVPMDPTPPAATEEEGS